MKKRKRKRRTREELNEEKELFIKYNSYKQEKRKRDLRNFIVEKYWYIVEILAHKYYRKNKHLSIEELISFGADGLLDAIEKYNVNKNVPFTSYVGYRIHGQIVDGVRRMDYVPRLTRQKAKIYSAKETELTIKNNRLPTEDEIARELGVSYKELYLKYIPHMKMSYSILREDDNGENKFITEIFENENAENPTKEITHDDSFMDIIKLVKSPTKRRVLLYYYNGYTMTEIAHLMHYSESRVSQLHAEAIDELKFKKGYIQVYEK